MEKKSPDARTNNPKSIKDEIKNCKNKLEEDTKNYKKTLKQFIDNDNPELQKYIDYEDNELKKIMFSSKKFHTHETKNKTKAIDSSENEIVDIFWAGETNNYSNQLLYCTKDTANLINASNKKLINSFNFQGQDLKTCAIEPSQNGLIAVGGIEGQVYVGEINTNNNYRKEDTNNNKKYTGHQGAVNSIRFLDHFFMISASSDSLIMLWDLNGQGKSLNSYHDHSSEILGLDVCELNPNFFVSASGDTTVKLWDIRDKKACIGTFKDSDSSVNCVKFVPGTFCTLAAGSEEGVIKLYDMRSYKTLARYDPSPSGGQKNGFGNSINSISFSKSGQLMFASSHNSNTITYWNLFKPEKPLNEFTHSDGSNKKTGIKQMCLNNSGNTFAYAINDSLYFLK